MCLSEEGTYAPIRSAVLGCVYDLWYRLCSVQLSLAKQLRNWTQYVSQAESSLNSALISINNPLILSE